MSKGTKPFDADQVLAEGIDVYTGRLFVSGGVDRDMYDSVLKQLSVLNQAPGLEKLTMIFSSEGGDVDYGLALYDLVKFNARPIDIIVCGRCMSAAVLVLQGARLRQATPSSQFLVHHGSMSADSEAEKKHDERVHKLYVEATAARTSVQKSTVYGWYRGETYMSADQALKVGLIDAISQGVN